MAQAYQLACLQSLGEQYSEELPELFFLLCLIPIGFFAHYPVLLSVVYLVILLPTSVGAKVTTTCQYGIGKSEHVIKWVP